MSADIYSSPERFDLEIIHMLEDETLGFEFDMFGVWLHKPSGAIFYTMDRGNSASTPFEDYRDLKSLGEPITAATFAAFEEDLRSFTVAPGFHESRVADTDKAEVLHDVKTRLGLYAGGETP